MNELATLAMAVSQLPQSCQQQVAPHLRRIAESYARRARTLRLMQKALSQLQLDVSYLVFDLESTRLERDEYRAELEKA